MKKLLFFIFILLFSAMLSAQNIVVESFVHLEMDLTANLEGTTVYDQNGEKCALIKVRSNPPAKGFSFDVGQLGVMKVEVKGAETWLYVPYGVRKISIQHEQLGFLDDYDLGMAVKKASTYMLTLRVGRVQTIVEEQIAKQYLSFEVTPIDALLEVNGNIWSLQDGYAAELVDYGKYEYRISAKDYHDEVGVVELNSEKKSVKVNLRPAFGWVEVTGSSDIAGAKAYIDNVYVGTIPFKSDKLSSGEHILRIAQKMYKDYVEKIIIPDNDVLTISPVMEQKFANVTFTTLDGAEIWIDRERRGVSSWTGRLEYGDHEIETKKASHHSQKKVYSISQSTNGETIALLQPIPIYGSLSVKTKPMGSSVYVDGELKGETPLFLPKVLVGSHEIEVSKVGKLSMRKTVTVREGEMFDIQDDLADDPRVAKTEPKVEPKREPKVEDREYSNARTDKSSVSEVEAKEEQGSKVRTLIMGQMGYAVAPQVSYGAMFGQMYRGVGWYLDFRSNFNFMSTPILECNELGKINGEKQFYTGKMEKMHLVVTGGLLVNFVEKSSKKRLNTFGMYVGGGYGSRTLNWELKGGDWARYAPTSYTGFSGNLGFFGSLSGLTLSVGVNTINFQYAEFEFGVGFMF